MPGQNLPPEAAEILSAEREVCIAAKNKFLDSLFEHREDFNALKIETLKVLDLEYKAMRDNGTAILKTDDRKKILRIIEFLQVKNIIGYYDNYKPIRLIKDFVSPTKNKINNIKASLFAIDE